MSVINQMLQDLEKRRASSSERRALPNQLRVLPPMQQSRKRWWLLLAAGAVVSAAGLAWQLRPAQSPMAPIAQPGVPPAAATPSTTHGPDVTAVMSSEDAAPQTVATPAFAVTAPAFRLALDLERVPAPDPPPQQSYKIGQNNPDTPAPVRTPVAKPQPPVSAATVVAAAPAAEAAKNSGPAAETVILMKAVAVAPAPSATAANMKPDLISKSAVPAPAPQPASRAGDDNKMQVAQGSPQIDKRTQQLTAQQLADNEYRDASNLFNQGKLAEAQHGFRLALQHYPAHTGARQGLVGLLLDAKKNGEAEQLLQDGLKANPNQPGFAMLMARLQVDRSDTANAIETLQKTAPSALNSPDYLAFLAALLQRQSRHPEAVDHYQAALRLAPGSGVWLMGLGISLQAVNRGADAQEAFRRAKATNTLNPELIAFVDQRLKQLQ